MMDALAWIGGVLIAVALAWIGGQRKGRAEKDEEMRHEYEADKARRLDAGRDAVRDGRDDGGAPDDRVRANDNHW